MEFADRREAILLKMREWAEQGHSADIENTHSMADKMLLELLDDPEVAEAFDALPKWYA